MQKKISRMRTLRQATSMMVVALAAAHAATAHATNITVNTTGAPVNGKCNITDAIQAATTNKAVPVGRPAEHHDSGGELRRTLAESPGRLSGVPVLCGHLLGRDRHHQEHQLAVE